MTARAASHVLMIAPVNFRYNAETGETNAFQAPPTPAEEKAVARTAVEQHRALRDLLVETGVRVTAVRSLPETPDASFCNNWFSTHPARQEDAGSGATPATVVFYPMLAPSRRIERRADLIELFRAVYPKIVDLADRETKGEILESTGSLCLDDNARVAYAALSPRTSEALARQWAQTLGYRLVTFTATDPAGVPYYHTNVMMFVGHGLAVIALESVENPAERAELEASLRASGLTIVPITRAQVAEFAGNGLALTNDVGEPLFTMSARAYRAFSSAERAAIERHGRILHTDLSVFEDVGGGSCRCLLGELF
ncbi:MAG: arginine deiminase-related protein [Gemmatimonadota bacterium]